MAHRVATAVLAACLVAVAGCGGQNQPAATGAAPTAQTAPNQITGTITVLTNRTDQVESGQADKYAAEFNKIYPNVQVKFEGLTDYEGEVKIRMSSEEYGDVLSIPNTVKVSQYPTFFEPLGPAEELSKKYDFTDRATVDGQVYGIANIGTAQGFVYNKAVWEKAGVKEWPKTPEEFLAGLQAIKDKTDATPYYTNYKDMWPLTMWGHALGSIGCDATAGDKLADTDNPWAPGQPLHVADKLLFDVVANKLTEDDPNTTNWEESKNLIANGKIATMALGSWAVVQMKEAATKAGQNPDDIAYMPFPSQTGGRFCTSVRPDYQYAVNVHSKNKPAAKAWIEWFITKSGDAQAALSISSVKGAALPSSLTPFEEAGVTFVRMDDKRAEQVDTIDKASEIGLGSPDYRQNIVDVARGAAKGDLNGIFADLNKRWAEARATVGE
ncbi:extracellular solute-binding protein [Nonomuraea soli]|uniref:ABC-type glycerol-3-phosphate transport system substrate-binding protein n=1 Tax=Nonomuraea soli TaxID=1032476 RepID=A0A7W0HQL8_9ACTN|nr:extracellular solute-binding protein [Nonomuraea soli]MBA2892074.1 ABC-type glycerol-3-phosphate transport system substrate-binding protein [Nonomuraea soli]